MASTKSNLVANFTGRAITTLISLVVVPVYLRYLGVEIYGIIFFFTSIQAFLLLLDGGISPTLNREVARLTPFPERAQELKDLSRTLEILCWSLALAACSVAMAVAPVLAEHWLNSPDIPVHVIQAALMLMSASFVFQWSIGFYTGGLLGLEEQGLANLVNVIATAVRSGGSVLVLIFVSATIEAFLIWQLVITAIHCLVLAIVFWRHLPKTAHRAYIRFNTLTHIWRYAAGMAGTSVVVLVLAQTDRVILSKLLTLENFGYYSLAMTLAGTGINMIVGSIQTVYFPKFSKLVAQGRDEEMRRVYHSGCQLMSLFLIPPVCALAFFSSQILLLWTHKPDVAQNSSLLLTLVAIGGGLNALMHIPYYAQLAYSVTKIGFWQNVIAIIFYVPYLVFATIRYGAVGGASGIVILNLFYTVVGMQVMNRMVLQGELKKWYLVDVGLPLVVVLVIDAVAYTLFQRIELLASSAIVEVAFLAAAGLTTFACAALVLPAPREFLFLTLRRIRYSN